MWRRISDSTYVVDAFKDEEDDAVRTPLTYSYTVV